MFTIFPFETEFYNQYGVQVHYVGNPTVDELSVKSFPSFNEFIKKNNLSDKPIIALLAGSRNQEISRILPVMAKVTGRFSQFQYVIAGAPSQNIERYENVLGDFKIPVVFGQTYDLLKHSTAALVASGTATLETAILNIPQVVCYRIEAGRLGSLVKEWLVKVPFISLVNLITGREVVKELFQETCTPEIVGNELDRILNNPQYRNEMLAGYQEMCDKLGGSGCAKRAAAGMIELLKTPPRVKP
jgi:lipid-A-disaccharide synthase